MLDLFRVTVQARAIDQFWKPRRQGQLAPHPERIGQGLLALFITGALRGRGFVVRELRSGVGYVDIVVLRGVVQHLLS